MEVVADLMLRLLLLVEALVYQLYLLILEEVVNYLAALPMAVPMLSMLLAEKVAN